jgi:hypothetical protein
MISNRWRRSTTAAVITAAAIGGAWAAHADEPLFAYAYTSDVLPKGKFEVEQWVTLREGQSQGSFRKYEFRSELEYGLTNNLQLSGYLNYAHVDANRNGVTGLTSGPGVPDDHDGTRPYSAWKWEGVSGEVIWRALSPYKDPIGLAFYVEPLIAPDEKELEFRAILHKTFLDDKLHLAANVVVEFEREVGREHDPLTGVVEKEIEHATFLEFNFGASYRFRPNWSAGVEYRAHSEYAGYGLGGEREFTTHFVGPNLHYASQDWFFTLTALFQLRSANVNAEHEADVVNGRFYGGDHTRLDGVRLKIGRVFR